MFHLHRLSHSSLVTFGGLLVGIVGLLIQWISDPAKFSAAQGTFGISFPPGIAFIVGFGVLMMLTARWWWHPVFGVLIAFWIAGVGTLAGELTPNLVSHNLGTVAGNAVMAAGLLLAFIAGLVSMTAGRRSRRVDRSRPGTV
ncbi:MAG: hypothetical protein LBV78_11980 [Kitasatospora sp.]|nr:hypothetical protein [Kitasatospora sp.]